jgi:hypothetical protein
MVYGGVWCVAWCMVYAWEVVYVMVAHRKGIDDHERA